ncbi:MAG: DUF3344 domain-containing protein [Candidatus Methanoculleus thermohydrogenotrophicum]
MKSSAGRTGILIPFVFTLVLAFLVTPAIAEESDNLTITGEIRLEKNIDLTIAGMVNTVPGSAAFCWQPNTVRVMNLKNQGSDAAENITLALYASDVDDGNTPVATTTIDRLDGGEAVGFPGIIMVDPTIREVAGGTVTYRVVVDPENLIEETDETNNEKSSTAKKLKYNGYNSKRYWTGGSDITTQKTYDLHGDIIYSTQPESQYKGVGWSDRIETWTTADLPVPETATVEEVLLFVSYNWDITSGGLPDWATTFNGEPVAITPGTPYTDKSNFGGYADHTYGLYVVDVTDYYTKDGDNTLVMTPNEGNSNAIYPSTLAVIYSDPNATRKQIFINEEMDYLGVSEASYGNTMEMATAYAPFTGMEIALDDVASATLHSFAVNAGPDEGNLLWNGETVATAAWQGTTMTAEALVFDVTDLLTATGNEAGIQGTDSAGMAAIQQFLVVEYPAEAPMIDFSADVTSGDAPLPVTFTATNTGGPVDDWLWDFGDNTTSTEQNPTHEYPGDGTYTVTLTATGPGGSDTATKENYITVGAATIAVSVTPDAIAFGRMEAGVDSTGSADVAVTTTGGTGWSVAAEASNGGYMMAGTNQLENPFHLANGDGEFHPMTGEFVDFMTGAAGESRTDTARVRQAIDGADAPGDYSITLTFTGTLA